MYWSICMFKNTPVSIFSWTTSDHMSIILPLICIPYLLFTAPPNKKYQISSFKVPSRSHLLLIIFEEDPCPPYFPFRYDTRKTPLATKNSSIIQCNPQNLPDFDAKQKSIIRLLYNKRRGGTSGTDLASSLLSHTRKEYIPLLEY